MDKSWSKKFAEHALKQLVALIKLVIFVLLLLLAMVGVDSICSTTAFADDHGAILKTIYFYGTVTAVAVFFATFLYRLIVLESDDARRS